MKNTQSLIAAALLCGASALEAGQTMRRALPVAGAAAAAYVGYQYGQRNAPARQDVIEREFINNRGAKAVLKFILQQGVVGAGSIEVFGQESKNLYTVKNCDWPIAIVVEHEACELMDRTSGELLGQTVVRTAEEVDALRCRLIVKDALNYLLTKLNAR